MDRKLQRARTLTEQAADEIRARIIRGNFELGEALSENMLAAELGVSKTPVREALLQLKREGLVDIQPQRGSFVFQMNAQEAVELSELREILETAAVLRALERDPAALAAALTRIVGQMRTAIEGDDFPGYRDLDADFHQAIVDHCGNGFLKESYAGITFRVQTLRTRLSIEFLPQLDLTRRAPTDPRPDQIRRCGAAPIPPRRAHLRKQAALHRHPCGSRVLRFRR